MTLPRFAAITVLCATAVTGCASSTPPSSSPSADSPSPSTPLDMTPTPTVSPSETSPPPSPAGWEKLTGCGVAGNPTKLGDMKTVEAGESHVDVPANWKKHTLPQTDVAFRLPAESPVYAGFALLPVGYKNTPTNIPGVETPTIVDVTQQEIVTSFNTANSNPETAFTGGRGEETLPGGKKVDCLRYTWTTPKGVYQRGVWFIPANRTPPTDSKTVLVVTFLANPPVDSPSTPPTTVEESWETVAATIPEQSLFDK